jgi:hypothetical protein
VVTKIVISFGRRMHESNPDLDSAVKFVVSRIAQEANRSGTPLTEHEEHFLYNLPKHPTNPAVNLNQGFYSRAGLPPMRALRDFSFERLCILAKVALGSN